MLRWPRKVCVLSSATHVSRRCGSSEALTRQGPSWNRAEQVEGPCWSSAAREAKILPSRRGFVRSKVSGCLFLWAAQNAGVSCLRRLLFFKLGLGDRIFDVTPRHRGDASVQQFWYGNTALSPVPMFKETMCVRTIRHCIIYIWIAL